jgi:transposase InsO family protein
MGEKVNSHKNAKLTARGREEMIRRMEFAPAAQVAKGFGVSLRTARKWMSRYRQGGTVALADKSSRPRRCRSKLTERALGRVFALRKERLTGDEITLRLGLCRSSVFRALRKLGCSRLSCLEEKEPIQRYQWEQPGQLLHLDIKRLGKIDGVGHKKAGTRQVCRRRPGWEYLHVCVDDASRAAYTAVLPDETAESAVEFLWFAVAWYALHGIKVERILTDNGSCYKSWKFRDACREFGIKHKRTRPYRPQTNGKAERFIRTALKEWAYAQTYTHSWKRTAYLPVWTHRYNYLRPHSALGRNPPASKLGG